MGIRDFSVLGSYECIFVEKRREEELKDLLGACVSVVKLRMDGWMGGWMGE